MKILETKTASNFLRISRVRVKAPCRFAALVLSLALFQASALEGSPDRIRVAGAQLPVSPDIATNVAALTRAIEFAAREKADVLLTPEGSLSGYTPEFDAKATQRALETITQLARQAGIGLVLGTCFEAEDGRRYNAQRFYDRSGAYLGFHAKILLCRRMSDPEAKSEIDCFQTRPLRTFRFDGLTVGGLICNDYWANPEWTPMDDPHLADRLADQGARLILVSANTGRSRAGDAQLLSRAFHESNIRMRARAAKRWVVVVNAGEPAEAAAESSLEGPRILHAPSGIVRPDGSWAVTIQATNEQFFVHTIELNPS
jgi:predicted amidohydrolase